MSFLVLIAAHTRILTVEVHCHTFLDVVELEVRTGLSFDFEAIGDDVIDGIDQL